MHDVRSLTIYRITSEGKKPIIKCEICYCIALLFFIVLIIHEHEPGTVRVSCMMP